MSSKKISQARSARDYLSEAEESAKRAKKLFRSIGDPDGADKAGNVEKVAKEAKEYVKRRLSKNNN